MVTCPKCKAENRPEAAFCSRCGTILFAQPAPSKAEEKPGDASTTIPAAAPAAIVQPMSSLAATEALAGTIETAPAIPVGLQPQPEGSVFGERFLYNSLLSQDEHEIRYIVSEIQRPDNLTVRICSNPECRTIHCPVGDVPEKYCTQCGHSLEEHSILFLLQEADTDKFSYAEPVLDLHLVHPNIHPPVSAFQQDSASGTRYYLAMPHSNDLPPEPEIVDVLEWGVQLAGALDYLQSKGVVLGNELDPASIGLVDSKAVWRDFSTVRILPMLTDREKINNLRLLSLAMYSMMTGRSTYSMDPYLPPSLNAVFEKALVGEGFTSGSDLIQQIELAKAGGAERLKLDIQTGRRSHAGIVRTVNEDSLLCMELSTIQHDGVLPYGLFAVADGMGGHAAGDLASSLVVSAIATTAFKDCAVFSHLYSNEYTDWFKGLVQAANQVVYDARQRDGNDMGSTLALCFLAGTQAYLTHQGDSRIYLINQETIKQLTTDHSLVQHMVSTGQITQEEARFHPQRNVIYRSLGDKPYIEVECAIQQVYPHDRLLLCSDGLTSAVEDEKIHQIVMEACSPQAACDQLVAAANAAGGDDNISVVLVEVITV